MCGRAACTLAPEEIQKQTQAKTFEGADEYKPSYNITPHQMHVVLLLDADNQPILKLMRWGLVPSWSKDGVANMHTINARAENLTTNNMWRGVVKRKRCIVLVNGYFEWTTERGQKIPFYIHHDDPEQLICLAGMYDVWTDSKTGEKRYTCTIVTTDSNPELAHIHDRMPVILESEEARQMWLKADGNDPSVEVLRLLRPYKGRHIVFDQVSTMVNSVKNNSPECLVPVKQLASKKQGILSFFNPKVKSEVKSEDGAAVKVKPEVKEEKDGQEKRSLKTVKAEEMEEEKQKIVVKHEPKDEEDEEEESEEDEIEDDGEEEDQEEAVEGKKKGKRTAKQPPRRIAKRKKRRTDEK